MGLTCTASERHPSLGRQRLILRVLLLPVDGIPCHYTLPREFHLIFKAFPTLLSGDRHCESKMSPPPPIHTPGWREAL